MFRWLFHIFSLGSFLLCLATVVMWVRSYAFGGGFIYPHYYNHPKVAGWVIESDDGKVSFGEGSARPDWIDVVDQRYFDLNHGFDWDLDRFDFVMPGIWTESFSDFASDFWCIAVSYYWLVVIFAGLPILWCFSFYRRTLRPRRRVKRNQCIGCGYNLQGSSGKCPECGMASVICDTPQG